jgi:alkanesulfonate monooxygenase SsuD/methylene tetrahydromethanopterin reductase-like flavin-dependent oxidoreductase (luciferase family)
MDAPTILSWLAACTARIRLGTSVLVLPYRAALPTAKWAATLQELSGHRLLLGVGIGWMAAEFRAVGVPLRERVRHSHATLRFLQHCFTQDEAVANGQPFLFLPRPPRPPIFVGGAAPHALQRAARYGDGWMPMTLDPARLRTPIAQYRAITEASGKPDGAVVALGGLPLHDKQRARAQLDALAELGVDTAVIGLRYDDAASFDSAMATLCDVAAPFLGAPDGASPAGSPPAAQ